MSGFYDKSYSALTFHNKMGAAMCPCDCWDDPYKVASYGVNFHTMTMKGYGDPQIKSISVWCNSCEKHELYSIDGRYRMSDFDF